MYMLCLHVLLQLPEDWQFIAMQHSQQVSMLGAILPCSQVIDIISKPSNDDAYVTHMLSIADSE